MEDDKFIDFDNMLKISKRLYTLYQHMLELEQALFFYGVDYNDLEEDGFLDDIRDRQSNLSLYKMQLQPLIDNLECYIVSYQKGGEQNVK